MVAVHNQGDRGSGGRWLKLAPGAELSSDRDSSAPMLLVLTAGTVHLNEHALAILELCDGSRNRGSVVTDAVMRSSGGIRAVDVIAFIDAARSRGWLVEED